MPRSPRLVALGLGLLLVAGGARADEPPAPPPWSTQEVTSAQAQCRANLTATGIDGPKVARYCECVTTALQARFSAAEVRRMKRAHDPGADDDNRPPALAKTLEQCSPVLESP
ncbi:hypothetical protein EVC62_04815 [Salinicola endophyticus]|uniref:UrcA family protein n=1 Tax=Salinicola endophyticus TaxID=1949083 RepID=A0ABY8FDI2_9GAMM|nr:MULTISPECIES: hypothetical protein [Salinicola]WFF40874.1 hypothetical protein EVC62_04815 [Salinicola endophyticus]